MSDALRASERFRGAVDAALSRFEADLVAGAAGQSVKVDSDPALIAELRLDEGVERSAYADSLGFLTIGVGRLIDKRKGGGLSDIEINFLLANDIARVKAELDAKLPWWRSLNPVRQRVLQNMGHQLGVNGVLNFKKAVAAMKAKQWATAAAEMLDSEWAREQSPDRAKRLAQMMKTGALP